MVTYPQQGLSQLISPHFRRTGYLCRVMLCGAMLVLCDAITVLYDAVTVLRGAMPVLCYAMTVLYDGVIVLCDAVGGVYCDHHFMSLSLSHSRYV
jgi:hypothetical protein